MGSTRSLAISDSLPLPPVELETPDPGQTFADPEGVEVTRVATVLSALPPIPPMTVLPLTVATFSADPEGVEVMIVAVVLSVVPSVTILPLEVALVGWSLDLEEDSELAVGVSALSTGVSGETEENKSDTDRVWRSGGRASG